MLTDTEIINVINTIIEDTTSGATNDSTIINNKKDRENNLFFQKPDSKLQKGIPGKITDIQPHNDKWIFLLDAGQAEIVGISPDDFDIMVGDEVTIDGEVIRTSNNRLAFKRINAYEITKKINRPLKV